MWGIIWLDTLQINIYNKKNVHVPPKLRSLPPTMAAFIPHCQRAHYQTTLWKATGMSSPPGLNPLQNGWEKTTSVLQPVYLIEGQSVVPTR